MSTLSPVLDYPEDFVESRWRLIGLPIAALLVGMVIGIAVLLILRLGIPKPPSYSRQEVAAASEEACQAWHIAGMTIAAQRQPFLDNPDDENRFIAAETGMLVQLNYIQQHIRPATPPELRKAIDEYVVAWTNMVAIYAQGIPTQSESVWHKSNDAVQRINTSRDAIRELCTK